MRAEAAPPSAGAGPPWPPSALEPEGLSRHDLAIWLSRPLALRRNGHGQAVPFPRHLADVWTRRSDVSRQFPLETERGIRDYLVWCLTHGVSDGDVDLALIGDTLGPWLDAIVAPTTEAQPPATRLMSWFADPAKVGPRALQGRWARAVWLIGAASRTYNWPAAMTARVRAWARERAGLFAWSDVPVPNLALAVWQMRPDVAETMPLATREGQLAFLAWLVDHGLDEMSLPPELVPEGVVAALAAHRPSAGGLRRLAAWRARLAAPPAARAPPPERIVLTGLCDDPRGRGEDVRMTARALARQGIAFRSLDRLAPPDTISREPFAETGVNIVHLNADTAMSDMLFARRAGLSAFHSVGHWAWELARFPAECRRAFACYDEIWAPSRFSFEAFAAASDLPVHLMPPTVEVPRPDPRRTRADFGIPDAAFAFYYGFDFRSYVARKYPEAAIRAFRAAFPNRGDPVVLILKSLGAAQHPDAMTRLLALAAGDPRIIVRDHAYGRRDLVTLVDLCDCFLSLHRAEGFGRGPAEGMLLGKPVIATAYSGNMDFMTAENALLVDYRLVPVGEGEYPGWRGQVWAEPDIDHASAHMRRLVEDPGLARRLGEPARATIRRLYGADVAGVALRRRLAALGVVDPLPRNPTEARPVPVCLTE